jgi:hypothetical protein
VIDAIRIAAIAVGGLLAVGPALAAAAAKLTEGTPVPGPAPAKPGADPGTSDAHLVLDIAGRLKAAGNKKAVDLCGQLIDAIMEPGK